jgi:predicted DNA binding CopG/RHH family protein
MKPVQYFSDEYLERCRNVKTEMILEYLESFRLMNRPSTKSKLISIKMPEPLLTSFRRKCELENVKYQTQIKRLMEQWLCSE